MLRKKNYKQEQHFTTYQSAYLLKSNGSKLTFYYKRYRPAKQMPSNIHEAINKNKNIQVKAEYPIDRTLQVISFDGDLQATRTIFKKIGKIRKFINGQTIYRDQRAYYSFVIFKYEFDLVKCFRDQYLQTIANSIVQGIKPSQQQLQQQRILLISSHLSKQLEQAQKLKQLYQQGYNPVTNKFGQFKVDYQANKKLVEDLPQVRKRKKMQEKRKLVKQKQQIKIQ